MTTGSRYESGPGVGRVASVMLNLDTQLDLLAYPGVHQLFFYSDFKQELPAYCICSACDPSWPDGQHPDLEWTPQLRSSV